MVIMDIQEILKILPHRYPMLMVDKIIECDDDKRIVGVKNLTYNESFFQGHFPGFPIMPGVLELEAMAQVGGILLSRKTGEREKTPLLMAVDKAKFRSTICPGDQMRIEVELLQSRSRVVRTHGKVLVDDKLASEADLLFSFSNEKVNHDTDPS